MTPRMKYLLFATVFSVTVWIAAITALAGFWRWAMTYF